MDELRKNNFATMITDVGDSLKGHVVDYSKDRVTIMIAPESIELAKNLEELDDLRVIVNTYMGLKEMNASVMDKLDTRNCITIENGPTVETVQKRAFVRVASNLKFKIQKNNDFYDCVCVNISAGGIAFLLHNSNLEIGDNVTIAFSKFEFEKDIITNAQIIKHDGDWFVAKYSNLNPHDEDKIVKYVFKTIAKY